MVEVACLTAFAARNLNAIQLSQAHKANIDYKIGKYLVPAKVRYEWSDSDYHE